MKRLDILDMPQDVNGVLGSHVRRELVKIHNYVRDYPDKTELLIETLEVVLASAKANLPKKTAKKKKGAK